MKYAPTVYPCGESGCVRLPLFGTGRPPEPSECCDQTRSVRMVNPCNPMESAWVILSVDSCGNLSVCVRRDDPRGSGGCCRRCT